jgi:hypothetical protein
MELPQALNPVSKILCPDDGDGRTEMGGLPQKNEEQLPVLRLSWTQEDALNRAQNGSSFSFDF